MQLQTRNGIKTISSKPHQPPRPRGNSRRGRFRKGCKPNFVCPEESGERIICLSSQYPKPVPQNGTRSGPLRGFLFGLAPDGVFRASRDCSPSGELLPHLFTLTPSLAGGAVYFLWHCPSKCLEAFLPRLSPESVRGYAASRPLVFGLSSSVPFETKAILRPSEIKGNITCRKPNDKICREKAKIRKIVTWDYKIGLEPRRPSQQRSTSTVRDSGSTR